MNWDKMAAWERNMLVHTQVMDSPGGGIPEYTTDMRVAWQVLQKIASRYSEQSQWLVVEQFKEFVEELCECSGNEIYPATKFFVRMAAWTPEYICLTALKACGVEIDDK